MAPLSTASGSRMPISGTATSSRSASTGSRSSNADGDDRSRLPAPASHDRHGLQPATGRVPRRLDLEDPLPRGPGAPQPAAHAGRLPALLGGRRRTTGDNSPPAEGRVSALARDP